MSSNNNANLCDQCKSVGLPIMPVRYAVTPKAVQPGLPAWADGNRVKDVPLGEDFHYALRTLREGYVYLFYSKNARGSNQWECYTVGQDGCLRLQPDPKMARPQDGSTFACSRQGHTNTALHYLVIERPEKCGPTWIAFSDTKWSDETIQEYTANTKLRNARMQTFHPAQMATGAKHRHGAIAEAPAIEQVIEYAPAFTDNQLPYQSTVADFSKEDGSYTASQVTKMSTRYPWHLRKGEAENLVKHMKRRGKGPKGDGTPHVLALWDGIGIAHELNGFRNDAAGWIKRYGDERELQITALNAIEGAKQALANKQRANLGDHKRRVMSGAAFKDTMRVKPNPRGWPDNARWVPFTEREDILKHGTGMGYVVLPDSYIDNAVAHGWEKYEARFEKGAKDKFKQQWDALLTAADQIIDRRTEALVKWLEAPLFIDTLEDFHPTNIEDGVMFEDVVGEAIFGIGSTKAGRAKLEAWIKEAKASVKSNLLWRAIALNQQEGIADVDAALQYAQETLLVPLTVESATKALQDSTKYLAKLSSLSKSALTLHNQLRKDGVTRIQTGGLERLLMTVGERVFVPFVKKGTDFVGEKIVQSMLLTRAGIEHSSIMALVVAEARHIKEGRTEAMLLLSMGKAIADKQTGNKYRDLSDAWKHLVSNADAPKPNAKPVLAGGFNEARDIRFALVATILQGLFVLKLAQDAENDPNSTRIRAELLAAKLALAGGGVDIGATAIKGLSKLGDAAISYQALKVAGGALVAWVSWISVELDVELATKAERDGRRILMRAYMWRARSNALAGGLSALGTLSYTAPAMKAIGTRFPASVLARGVAAIGGRLLAARALLMLGGIGFSVASLAITLAIWYFGDNDLQIWCERCAFGVDRSGKDGFRSVEQQDTAFDKAVMDVL